MNKSEGYASAVLIGAITGMRSMSSPAVLAQLGARGAIVGISGKWSILRGSQFQTISVFLALGEMIADKLPFVPARTSLGPLGARAVIGGLCGAAIAWSSQRPRWAGALIGATAAVGTAYGAYHLRRQAVMNSALPDPIIALAEDAIVVSIGAALVSRLSVGASA